MERCANCERAIGNLETPHLHGGAIVCGQCAGILNASPRSRATVPTAAAGTTCQHCGGGGVYAARGVVGSEIPVCILLLFACLIPGVVFYAVNDGRPYCPRCRVRVRPA